MNSQARGITAEVHRLDRDQAPYEEAGILLGSTVGFHPIAKPTPRAFIKRWQPCRTRRSRFPKRAVRAEDVKQ